MYPDLRDEKQRKLEFPTSAITILNSLEQMGYRVVTSGAFVASQVTSSKVNCDTEGDSDGDDDLAGEAEQVHTEGVHMDCAQEYKGSGIG